MIIFLGIIVLLVICGAFIYWGKSQNGQKKANSPVSEGEKTEPEQFTTILERERKIDGYHYFKVQKGGNISAILVNKSHSCLVKVNLSVGSNYWLKVKPLPKNQQIIIEAKDYIELEDNWEISEQEVLFLVMYEGKDDGYYWFNRFNSSSAENNNVFGIASNHPCLEGKKIFHGTTCKLRVWEGEKLKIYYNEEDYINIKTM